MFLYYCSFSQLYRYKPWGEDLLRGNLQIKYKCIQMQLILVYFYMIMFIYKFIVLLQLRIEIQMNSEAQLKKQNRRNGVLVFSTKKGREVKNCNKNSKYQHLSSYTKYIEKSDFLEANIFKRCTQTEFSCVLR